MAASGHKASFWGDENNSKMDGGDSCITVNVLKTIEVYTLID